MGRGTARRSARARRNRRRGILILLLAMLLAILFQLGFLDPEGLIPAFRGGDDAGTGAADESGASQARLGAGGAAGHRERTSPPPRGRAASGRVLRIVLVEWPRAALREHLVEPQAALHRVVRECMERGSFFEARYRLDRFARNYPYCEQVAPEALVALASELDECATAWLEERRARTRDLVAEGPATEALQVAAELLRAGTPAALTEAAGLWAATRGPQAPNWGLAELGAAWREAWLAYVAEPEENRTLLIERLGAAWSHCSAEAARAPAALLVRELGLVAWPLHFEAHSGALQGAIQLPADADPEELARSLFGRLGLERDHALFALAIAAAAARQRPLAERALELAGGVEETRVARAHFIAALLGG